jgi:hypothetical protein
LSAGSIASTNAALEDVAREIGDETAGRVGDGRIDRNGPVGAREVRLFLTFLTGQHDGGAAEQEHDREHEQGRTGGWQHGSPPAGAAT